MYALSALALMRSPLLARAVLIIYYAAVEVQRLQPFTFFYLYVTLVPHEESLSQLVQTGVSIHLGRAFTERRLQCLAISTFVIYIYYKVLRLLNIFISSDKPTYKSIHMRWISFNILKQTLKKTCNTTVTNNQTNIIYIH